MSTQTNESTGRRGTDRNDSRVHHLVGRDVFYQGKVWRVAKSDAKRRAHGDAWLTLRRGGVKAMAKAYELRIAAN